uniref:Uncharacterized protein n=1 Tax=Cacopsylla melanoneura TaxID=428564 RepID=A0A8D8Y4F0_9HEMI
MFYNLSTNKQQRCKMCSFYYYFRFFKFKLKNVGTIERKVFFFRCRKDFCSFRLKIMLLLYECSFIFSVILFSIIKFKKSFLSSSSFYYFLAKAYEFIQKIVFLYIFFHVVYFIEKAKM